MNKKIIARELILTAKELLADTKSDYVYDPDHKNKPKGGGWEKTEKGWTQKKKTVNKEKPKQKKFDYGIPGYKEPTTEEELEWDNVSFYGKIKQPEEVTPENIKEQNLATRLWYTGWGEKPRPELMMALTTDWNPVVRLSIAKNYDASYEVLEKLTHDRNKKIRNTSLETIKWKKKYDPEFNKIY